MNDQLTDGSLALEVSNFGPIAKGKIDLRPLTVFVGPSNTGKSYMAILIYALHRYFSAGTRPIRESFPLSRRLLEGEDESLTTQIIGDLMEWAEQELGDSIGQKSLFDPEEHIQDTQSFVLPISVTKSIQSALDTQGRPLSFEIRRCFGANTGDLVRKGVRSNAQIVVRRQLPKTSFDSGHILTLGPHGGKLESSVPKELEIGLKYRDFYYNIHQELNELKRVLHQGSLEIGTKSKFSFLRLLENLADLALPPLFGALCHPAFYLPADRTGIMHAHSVVVSAMIGSAPMTGLRPAPRTPTLSGVLADFLEQLIEIDRSPHRPLQPHRDHAAWIENGVLGGKVRINRAEMTSYPSFTYQPIGWKDRLPLMNASSMVSELAPVVLYLRHWVSPDELLIVEEPESHLHPAMQVAFTRELANLVHSGIRVLITTHSEWVLEELANIVRRSDLPEGQKRAGTDRDVALRPDQVGAWLFKPKSRPRGSVVEEIRLDDSGLYPSGFDEVAAALHNDWAEISSQIGDDK